MTTTTGQPPCIVKGCRDHNCNHPRERAPVRQVAGEDLVKQLHSMGVTERIQLLDWLARNRTGMLRSGMRDWKATRNT